MIVRTVERYAGISLKGAHVFIVPYGWSEVRHYPLLAQLWITMRATDVNRRAFDGDLLSENDVQINPAPRLATFVSFVDIRVSPQEWKFVTIVAHELIHVAYERDGIPTRKHHCLMMSGRRTYPDAIQDIGTELAVHPLNIAVRINIDVRLDTHFCK